MNQKKFNKFRNKEHRLITGKLKGVTVFLHLENVNTPIKVNLTKTEQISLMKNLSSFHDAYQGTNSVEITKRIEEG